jgi:hypothetical protein
VVKRLPLLLLSIQAVWAQYVVGARAGTVHFVTGEVLVDSKPAGWTPLKFPLLEKGQILSTGNGRAEILLGAGVFLRLGRHSAIRMLDNSLEDAQVEIRRGDALVEVVDIPKGSDVHVVLGPTRTSFTGIGLHRFEVGPHRLRVFGGHAEVAAGSRRTQAGRGAAVDLSDTLSVSKFNPRRKDDLLVWSANRSFQLFMSDLSARSHRTNWEIRHVSPAPIGPGALANMNLSSYPPSDQDLAYISNRDFGVTFYSHAWAKNPALRAPVPVTPNPAAPQ